MQFTDLCHHVTVGFPWWSNGKEFICKEGDPSLIPNQKNPGKGNDNPLQYS